MRQCVASSTAHTSLWHWSLLRLHFLRREVKGEDPRKDQEVVATNIDLAPLSNFSLTARSRAALFCISRL